MDAVKTKKKKKKSKKKLIITLVVLVVIIAAIFVACRGMKKAAEARMAAMNAMQTDTVTVRELTKSIGATGTVISVQSKDITAVLSGVDITELPVEVGDVVEEGQVLVQFDTEDIAENLAMAERALAQTQGQYGISTENAQRQVEDAVRGVDYQTRLAYNNMESAWLSYSSACDSLEDLEIAEEEAYDAWMQVEDNYDAAEEAIKDAANETPKDGIELEWNGKTYTISQEQLEELAEKLRDLGIDIPETIDLQTIIAYVTSGMTQAETACAQAEQAYEQAKSARESMQTNVDSLYIVYENAVINYDNTVASGGSTVAAAQAAQDSAELSVNTDQQQQQIDALAEQLEKGVMTAPFAGVVTAVDLEEGDTYLQGAIMTIQDCSSFEIEAQIGEYDISDIKLGQKVIIKTDATREQELEGTVVFISPTATAAVDMMTGVQTASADPTYEVRISVDTPSDRLRLDMSANLSIIIDQHDNAMTVPYNAVQIAEDGSTFVEVVGADGESLTVVPVEVLMESNYYTEISGDLKEGDVVRIVAQETSDMFSVMAEMSPMGGGGF